MSSRYPILDNRPIDQWKVTELKEELKKRKLTTKGLKDDLIKRLDEALRIERENAMKDAENGINLDSQHVSAEKQSEPVSVARKKAEVVVDDANEKEKVDNSTAQDFQIDINDSLEAEDQGYKVQEDIVMDGGTNSYTVEGELAANTSTVETSATVTQNVVSEFALDSSIGVKGNVTSDGTLSGQIAHGSETQETLGIDDSRLQQDDKDTKIQLEGEDLKPQMEKEVSKSLLDKKDMKPAHEDAMYDTSTTANQVSEVSPNLGFQVKSDSISTDSVSINEKLELKDNIIADNVKLELDVVKPEIVEPLSDNVVPVGGESHPMDVEEPQEKKPSVGDKDTINASNADISKKNDIVEIIDSEKLNLDRSSGDDSMEDDVLESKQIDSKYNPDEVGDKTEKNEVIAGKEENLADIVGKDSSTEQKEVHDENKIRSSGPTEKRKLNDKENVVNEPLKRQRRWNSETIKTSETETTNLTPTTTPKDAVQPAPMQRSFSRSNSSVSEDTPKERVVPPSQKPPTNSLRIDRFVRPFTLKAVQELLEKTGTSTSFWMDQIKTHCYVTYSSVDEAIETRNAVYNLQWPPNGGRLLVADFVDPQEVKMRVEAPPQSPATPVTPSVPVASTLQPQPQPQPSPRQQVPRQQLPPPPVLPPPPPLSNPPLAKERFAHPPPPLPEKHEPPIVTLDDLFQKTKATPRIYYLPLSEEQVAAKLAERGRSTK
ncbi:hypothetical protein K2173_005172 [Erythroxylum novogranatense]|uniref:SAP domain-containing protein n=1 Tax=Erythroxylum novogranatense TaxID=1862640 RepID=A0AAV8TU01_9ROSI|nr:hypothetical protein K2173_005172 [Erythroxylum novogranatense]